MAVLQAKHGLYCLQGRQCLRGCSRILKQTNLRRQISKKEKTDTGYDNGGPQDKGKGRGPTGQSKAVNCEKSSQYTDDKGCNIQRHKSFPQNAAIGIKEHRNEKGGKENSTGGGGDNAGIFSFQHRRQIKGKKQHGEEAELHMLPGRLIYRGKEAYNEILTGPVVNKMGNGTGDQNKNKSNDKYSL